MGRFKREAWEVRRLAVCRRWFLWPMVTTGIGIAAGPTPAYEHRASGPGGPDAARPDRPVRPTPSPAARWSPEHLDRTTLPALLAEAGLQPPSGFKALVVRVHREPDGPKYTFYDFSGTSQDRDDWWPASTVKVFAAVAALERLREWGFTPRATVTFHDPSGDVTRPVEWLVRQAITHSDNAAFDLLVEVVGGDEMNRWLRERRFRDTVLLRGYSRRHVDPASKHGILSVSAPITVQEAGRLPRRLPARKGRIRDGCRDLGNCTTLWDLCDCLRRVMLHDRLPDRERLDLGPEEVDLLRSALGGPRERGLGVVRGLRAAFAPREVTCFHKPGFALNWFSDHVFLAVGDPAFPEAEWVVAMAARGGRNALDEAARVVGRVLATGRLRSTPALPGPAGEGPASGQSGRSGRPPHPDRNPRPRRSPAGPRGPRS